MANDRDWSDHPAYPDVLAMYQGRSASPGYLAWLAFQALHVGGFVILPADSTDQGRHAALLNRVEGMVRLMVPDDMTPVAARMFNAMLTEERAR